MIRPLHRVFVISLSFSLLGSLAGTQTLRAQTQQGGLGDDRAPVAPTTRGMSVQESDPGSTSKLHPTMLRRLNDATDAGTVKAWVLFADKDIADRREYDAAVRTVASTYDPRAIERRRLRRARPELFDEQDLPVPEHYLDQVAASGAELRVVSRWVNGVSVVGTRAQFERIAELSFVRIIQPVRRGRKILPKQVVDLPAPVLPRGGVSQTASGSFYGESEEQLAQLNLINVHNDGYTGAGVVVGILDTGFQRSHSAFNDPTHPLSVIAEYDFIDDDPDTSIEPGDPDSQHRHGTLILGTLGAYEPGGLVGAAYDASFILCKTEDTTDEYPGEEDNYVAGLEFIEANGGDLATSSLSYSDWYTGSDYDGLTAVTTIAVNTATANGLHCCTAAGNGGHDDDPATARLGAPADAFQVLTCGAVDATGTTASFSSDGPTADGRVKPEVLARGVNTRTVSPSNDVDYAGAGGTSLSTPLVAGVVACLVQARPEWTVDQLRSHLLETSDYYVANGTFDPTFVRGYGVVNAAAALGGLDCNGNGIPDDQDIADQTSTDDDGNGVPDECECAAVSDPPGQPSPVVLKNRYLSITPANAGEQTALRITPIELPPGYESLRGEHWWVDTPQDISEKSGSSGSVPPTFVGAALTCDPVYLDWGATGTLHVYGEVLVPEGTYEVRAIHQSCFTGANNNYSAAVIFDASLWGDIVSDCSVTPCGPPDGDADFDDISALVDKFRNLLHAPVKARADIAPRLPDRVVDFIDIAWAVDAFRGPPYSFPPPEPCPQR